MSENCWKVIFFKIHKFPFHKGETDYTRGYISLNIWYETALRLSMCFYVWFGDSSESFIYGLCSDTRERMNHSDQRYPRRI